jgi:hypothetical protein
MIIDYSKKFSDISLRQGKLKAEPNLEIPNVFVSRYYSNPYIDGISNTMLVAPGTELVVPGAELLANLALKDLYVATVDIDNSFENNMGIKILLSNDVKNLMLISSAPFSSKMEDMILSIREVNKSVKIFVNGITSGYAAKSMWKVGADVVVVSGKHECKAFNTNTLPILMDVKEAANDTITSVHGNLIDSSHKQIMCNDYDDDSSGWLKALVLCDYVNIDKTDEQPLTQNKIKNLKKQLSLAMLATGSEDFEDFKSSKFCGLSI